MRIYTAAAHQANMLGVDPEAGLSEQAVLQSRQVHGDNQLPTPREKSLGAIFIEALLDRTLLILVGAAVLSLGVEVVRTLVEPGYSPHFVDGVAILAAVLIASGVTTLNDWQAARQFRLLGKLRDEVSVSVRRDAQVRSLSIFDLVVGDIVILEAGDRIPADGLLLTGTDVAVDQSTMTGESVPVEKSDDDLLLRAGTTLTSGSCTMLVTSVGESSELGKLQAGLQTARQSITPLQERLGRLADYIGIVGASAAILTFLALTMAEVWFRGFVPGFDLATAARLLEFVIVGVTIVVVAVPEGLPLAVTISLAYSVRKMAEDKNLVRTLASCETMGAATIICSDKTGTLTENRMTVVDGWASAGSERRGVGEWFFSFFRRLTSSVEGDDPIQVSGPSADAFSKESALRICQVCAINSTAYLEETVGGMDVVGNPTEGALLRWMDEAWGDDWLSRRQEANIVAQKGFSSDRKQMATVIDESGSLILLVKGAPEQIIAQSSLVATPSGSLAWDEASRPSILQKLSEFSGFGHRTLALAYRKLPQGTSPETAIEAYQDDLVFLALIAIADPVRADVPDALEACRIAGVEVKLVTGDHQATAMAVAQQIGLIQDGDIALEGEAFRKMTDEELKEKLPRLRVLSRSVPLDKLRLVEALKASGEVVAVTGDGTNDGPALRSADVGFSMGVAGTELAKEASDIVLLDDNFSSIVSAIRWGRGIFENVRRFLQFQLTVNLVALSTALLAALMGFGLPLTTVQLLWVNLIMDTLAALALATEAPAEDLLLRKPHGRHEPLITSSMTTQIIGMGLFMLAILLGLLIWDGWLPHELSSQQKLTFIFNTFVMMQIFNEINARSTRFNRSVFVGLEKNHLFIGVIVGTLLVQILIVQFGGSFFSTTPLSTSLWGLSFGLGVLMLPFGLFLRAAGRFWGPKEVNA